MAADFFGYLGCSKPLPAQGDDAGAQDPVAGGVAAAGQLTDLRHFCRVFGYAGVQKFRHGLLLPGLRFADKLMCTAFEERSTRLLAEGMDVPPGAMARILEDLYAEGQITGPQPADREGRQLHGGRAIIEPERRL
jgi:hypothetical protein